MIEMLVTSDFRGQTKEGFRSDYWKYPTFHGVGFREFKNNVRLEALCNSDPNNSRRFMLKAYIKMPLLKGAFENLYLYSCWTMENSSQIAGEGESLIITPSKIEDLNKEIEIRTEELWLTFNAIIKRGAWDTKTATFKIDKKRLDEMDFILKDAPQVKLFNIPWQSNMEKCDWCDEEKELESIITGDRVCAECMEEDDNESEDDGDTEESHGENVQA